MDAEVVVGKTMVYTGAKGEFELTVGKRKAYAVSAEGWKIQKNSNLEDNERRVLLDVRWAIKKQEAGGESLAESGIVVVASLRDRELHLPGQVGGFQVLHELLDHAYIRNVRPEPILILGCSCSYSDPAGRPN